jgi:hypothetical protein
MLKIHCIGYLDMTFNNDRQRKRNKNAIQNSQAQKIALNILKSEDSTKISLKTKRLKAIWDNKFQLKILGFY